MDHFNLDVVRVWKLFSKYQWLFGICYRTVVDETTARNILRFIVMWAVTWCSLSVR